MAATCSEPGCSNPSRSNGLCNTHHQWHWRHGTLPPGRETKGPDAICAAPDCDERIGRTGARGLCPKHYQRLTKGKSPGIEQPMATAPDEERFWSKVNRSDVGDCWPWTGGRQPKTGYGNVWWEGTTQLAHRVAYQLAVGAIPEGMHIDHVYERGCRLRHCCNPAHLEAVTPTVNNQRIPITPVVSARRSAAGKKAWSKVKAARLQADGLPVEQPEQ